MASVPLARIKLGARALILPVNLETRPFDLGQYAVAAMVAVWRTLDSAFWGAFSWGVGSFGGGPEIEIDRDMLAQITPPVSIPDSVLLYLADKVFPDCEAITTLWSTVVVELPWMDEEEHWDRLRNLPEGFKDRYVILRYYNGLLPCNKHGRGFVSPSAKSMDGSGDETDYMALDKTFYPGTMLRSIKAAMDGHCKPTAGVLVEQGGERRLTCSFHMWEMHHNSRADMFDLTHLDSRRYFKAIQGMDLGTNIGFVRERIGDSKYWPRAASRRCEV